jgi:F0F1-type ATP synthase delta subunit
MKYPSHFYARALAAVLAKGVPAEKEKKIIQNFLNLLRKNNDEKKLPRIVTETEKMVLAQSGRRKVVLESARPLGAKQKKLLSKILKPGDVVEEKVSPEVVAGVRITVNEELQFDGTLNRKLKKMFP